MALLRDRGRYKRVKERVAFMADFEYTRLWRL